MAYPHKWSPISYKSSAGQRKHTGQRPMLYRWTTPPGRWRRRSQHCAAYIASGRGWLAGDWLSTRGVLNITAAAVNQNLKEISMQVSEYTHSTHSQLYGL